LNAALNEGGVICHGRCAKIAVPAE